MLLTCEDCEPIEGICEAQLDEILSSDVFGKYAILSRSETIFIQAASDWQPTDECLDFLKRNGSDPWIMEYRDTVGHYSVTGYITLDTVIGAFKSYLRGDQEWLIQFDWKLMGT